MSIAAVGAVLDHSEAKGNARMVLLVMANYANEAGHCWPSVKSVAKRCNCPERSVHRSLAALVAAGELVKVGTRYGNIVEYQLGAVLNGKPCQGVAPDPCHDVTPPCQGVTTDEPEPCQGVTLP